MPDRVCSTDQGYLRNDQYRDGRNLSARANLHARFSTHPQRWFHWVFDQLRLPERAHVLELGCGPGGLWRENLERVPSGWAVTLSDFSPGMVEEARQALEQATRPFSFEVIDAQAIPLPDASFDAVIADHMLYHVPSVPRALGEIRRVLCPEGRLFAATNGREHMQGLWDLLTEFVGEPDAAASATRGFELENGRDLLSAQFRHIGLHRYEDALEVTEAEPLVAYVLSMMDTALVARIASQQEAFRAFVAARLARGPIHIGKAIGMFIASG